MQSVLSLAALKSLSARRIGYASPYVKEINDQSCAFFEKAGFKVASRSDIGRPLSSLEQGALTPDEIIALTKRAIRPDVDALVLPCTDIRAVECIETIEALFDVPVVTSNQAILFALATSLQLGSQPGQPGRIWTH